MKLLNNFRMNGKKLIYNAEDLYNLTKAKTKEKIIKKCLNLTSLCKYSASPYDYRKNLNNGLETNNIFKFLNTYLYGSCHNITFFMAYLLKIHGIDSRIIYLKSPMKFTHLGLEVYYNKDWHYFDPTLGIFFYYKFKKVILSLDEIKKNIFSSKLIPNKKISFKKFKVDIKNHVFNYKKKSSFKNASKKYYTFFYKTEKFCLLDNKFSYKKPFLLNHGLVDYYTFRETYYYDNNFKIKNSNLSYGILYGKRVKSNKCIKFKNYIYTKNVYSNRIKINDFPFTILDLKLHLKSQSSKINIFINSTKYNILVSTNFWLLSQLNRKKNIFATPLRSFFISSENQIKSLEILFLKSNTIDKIKLK